MARVCALSLAGMGPARTFQPPWLFVRALLMAALALLMAPHPAFAAYWEATLPGSAFAGVIRGPGGFLFGATYDGGTNGDGTLYKVPPDLSTVTTIHEFDASVDGAVPYAELIVGTGAGAGKLFGTTDTGGPGGAAGTVFSFDPAFNVLTTLLSFSGFGAGSPSGPLLQIDDYLYGGTHGSSPVVYRVLTDGSGYQVLRTLDIAEGTNLGALTLGPDGFLYGTAFYGGDTTCYSPVGCGTVFRLKPDGSDFALLYVFSDPLPTPPYYEDPVNPERKLVYGSDGRLCGTSYKHVWSLAPDPSTPDFQVVYAPPSRVGGNQIFTPPIEGTDGRLYITQYDGGANFAGSLYSMNKNGTDLLVHHVFPDFNGSHGPYGIPYRDTAGTLYGTTEYSGNAPEYRGVVFAIVGANQQPVAVATAPATIAAGAGCVALVDLDGTGSYDPDNDPLTYDWQEGGVSIAMGDQPTIPLGAGAHTITLVVTDPASAYDSTTVVVTVTTDATLTYTGPALLQEKGTNTLTASLTSAGGPITGAAVVLTVNGTPHNATTDVAGVASVDVTFAPGTSSTTIKIDYAGGGCGSGATTTVTIPVNRWPTAVASVSDPNVAGANCKAQVTLTGSASTDLDSDTLTYLWKEGATTLATTAVATVEMTAGDHAVSLTVNDGRGGSHTANVTAQVLGQPTTLQYTGPPQLTAGISTAVSALLEAGGSPLAGATVTFTLDGASASNTTTASGVATANVTATTLGTRNLRTAYLGDTCHQGATVDTSVEVVPQPATMKVIKSVVNNNGGTATAGDFTLSVTGTTPSPSAFSGSAAGTDLTLSPGAYSVSEGSHFGYQVSYSTDCSGTIASGETKTCTVTNDDIPPQLTLVKDVVNNNGGTAAATDWVLSATTGPTPVSGAGGVTSGATFQAGTYALGESGSPAGYAAGNWSCTGGSLVGTDLTLTVGQAATCSIVNDDVPPQLTLVKQVINDNGGTAAATAWILSAAGGPTPISGAGGVTSGSTFYAGTYALSESGGPAGYTAGNWNCTGNGTQNGSNVTLALGQSAICTIVNDDNPPQAATLRVIKSVVNNNGGTATAGDFTLSVTGTTPSPSAFSGSAAGTDLTLSPGAYSVSEGSHFGYQVSYSTDCSGTIASGETKTCTVTNDDISPVLTLVKSVINNNGGTAVPGDWSLSATGTATSISGASGVTSGATFQAGVYALSETGGLPGYAAGAWSCTGGNLSGANLTLTVGQVATCTIANDDIPPKLTLVKSVINNNGGTAAGTDWTLTASGAVTPISGAGGVTSGPSFYAGTYALWESGGPAGYAAGNWSCSGGTQNGSNITLALGEIATCTIINDDIPPKLTLNKQVVNNNGGTAVATDWTLSAMGSVTSITGTSGVTSGPTFYAGTYALGETGGLPGYAAGSWNCSGVTPSGSNITLALAQVATCTIVNDDIPPTLTLVKQVVNDNGRTAVATDWTLSATGSVTSISGMSGVTSGPRFYAGIYALSESGGPSLYAASTWNCAGGSQSGSNIALALAQTATCTIVNDDIEKPPVANPDSAFTPVQTPVVIRVLDNDHDDDGDPMTIVGTTSPSKGKIQVNPDGTITYSPKGTFKGVDTFTYSISDGHGGTASATVTVSVGGNAPPKAVADRAVTVPDTPVIIAVLANDSDPDGDPLTITDVTQGANGTVVNNGGATVTYTPTSLFNGWDRFFYTISDGNGGTATAVVRVRLQ